MLSFHDHAECVFIVIFNFYFKPIYGLVLLIFTWPIRSLTYKRLFASALPVEPVTVFCIRYRWSSIHKTRLPALPLLTALPICPLFRTFKSVFCILAYFCFLYLCSLVYLTTVSGCECCCKCILMNSIYLSPIYKNDLPIRYNIMQCNNYFIYHYNVAG